MAERNITATTGVIAESAITRFNERKSMKTNIHIKIESLLGKKRFGNGLFQRSKEILCKRSTMRKAWFVCCILFSFFVGEPTALGTIKALDAIDSTQGKNVEQYDIDIQTSFLKSNKGILLTREFLTNNLKIHEQVNTLKEKANSGDENAMLLLLSAAWHVLPPNEVRAIIELAHPNKGKNPMIYYYLGLFHAVGMGCTYDPDIALRLFYIAYKAGCQRAGIEFFDRMCLCPGTDFKAAIEEWKSLWKGPEDDPDFVARIAWAEICGLGIPRNESKGWMKMEGAAAKGSKFAKMHLGRRFAEKGDQANAVIFFREALSLDLYVGTHIYLADVLGCVQKGVSEEIELLYYEAARKLNHGGLSKLAEIFEKRGDHEESVRHYLYAGLILTEKVDIFEENTLKEKVPDGKIEFKNELYAGKTTLESEMEKIEDKIEQLINKGAFKNDFKILNPETRDF